MGSRSRNDVQYDELHGVAKGDVEQSSKSIAHVAGHRLGRKAKEASQGDDGYAVHGKHDAAMDAGDVCDDDADGHKDQQDVEPAVCQSQAKGATDFCHEVAMLLGGHGAPILHLAVVIVVVGARAVLGRLGVYDRPLSLIFRRWRGRKAARESAWGGVTELLVGRVDGSARVSDDIVGEEAIGCEVGVVDGLD